MSVHTKWEILSGIPEEMNLMPSADSRLFVTNVSVWFWPKQIFRQFIKLHIKILCVAYFWYRRRWGKFEYYFWVVDLYYTKSLILFGCLSVCVRASNQRATPKLYTITWIFLQNLTRLFPVVVLTSFLQIWCYILRYWYLKFLKKKPILKIMTAFERVTLPAASSDNVTMASHSHPIPIYTISFTQAAVKIPKTENDITMWSPLPICKLWECFFIVVRRGM